MFDFAGRTVLITGASSGIGEEMARQLAAQGSHLVLVARTERALRALADELGASHGVRVDVIALDLARSGAASEVRELVRARGIVVDVLVNNAGFATHGRFEELPIARQSEAIALNVVALVELTHAFLPDVIARRGGVIQVASTAAFQPVPYMATYGATKAFVLSFSEALWAELRDRDVRVLALCPGATETRFFDVVGAEEAAVGRKASPADVVREGLAAFRRDRSTVVTGWGNWLLAGVSRFTSREIAARITARLTRPRGPRALRAAV
ncbi:SDR family NAD(P)-dependent oxidoreductase [Sandaracinus amylolyticus]|uniref:SDR family NAD(P)-dependent oxidoreductase n=1 Tax=Sandaracinus amylolyticus TaxID=927083 RepID=UPI001F2BFDF5|nr:SDR family oxidoreductase [Sandaracinus amylolyticus]UJR78318.1 Sulfoacetaldehyde reductase [Sandaracinus amylolyticus]